MFDVIAMLMPYSLLLCLLMLTVVDGLNNGQGLTPPMGFNTWNHFGCVPPVGHLGPSDELMRSMADTIVNDCWQLTERSLPWDDPNARQVANPERFPNGMKALADYIHGKGLKFGLFAASFGHEVVDAKQWMDECYGAVEPPTWTGWNDTGIKPTRADGSCHDLDPDPIHRLGVMRDALNASGRSIFFSNEFAAATENYPHG
eukprot:gene23784-479_t